MPSLPRPGDRLAGFRIERELGHGTTGVVYLAHQEELDRRVALKVVGRPLAGDAAFRGRFRDEARAVASLDHPNVVQVLESGEDEAHLWLAMRLVDGPDLRVLLRRTGRLEPAQAVAVVEQVAAALDAAHAAGLVHRDVKPSNVLIEDGPGRDLHVELADFGLARAPGVDDAEGTPGYAAPEQLAGVEAGPAADVFGLGCVLFELLTGAAPPAVKAVATGDVPWRRGAGAAVGASVPDRAAGGTDGAEEAPAGASPAAAGSRDHAARDPRAVAAYAALLPLTPSVALPRLGGAFDPAVERATAADPAARFASAGELAMWARAALSVPRSAPAPDAAAPVRAAAATPASPAEVGPAAPTWEIPPAPRRRRGRRLLVAALLTLILALLGTAFVFIGSLGDSSRDRQAGTTAGVPTPPGRTAGGSSGAAGSAAGAGPANGAEGRTAGGASGSTASESGVAGGPTAGRGPRSSGSGAAGGTSTGAARAAGSGRSGSASSARSSGVPDAGRGAPTGATTVALPPVPAGAVRFGGGGWVLDLPAAEGWRQTAVQELDGGARLVTRLARPDAVRLVVEALPGRTAVVGAPVSAPGALAFPVRLPDAGRTDGALFRGGRYAMCTTGVCAALPANGPNGGVVLIAGAHRAAGAKRIARRAAAGLRVR